MISDNFGRGHVFRIVAGIAVLSLLLAGGAGAQTTQTVCPTCSPYSSIQAAINDADAGDTIEVESGL